MQGFKLVNKKRESQKAKCEQQDKDRQTER